MAKQKQIATQVKIQITAGQATPAPPVGTALGPHGVNIGQFVQQFNERTREMMGTIVPAVVTIFTDRSFEFIIKSPPASVLLKKAAQLAKGAANPRTEKVGRVTKDQVREIAKTKLVDLNTRSLDSACAVIEGTARSMGIVVVE